MRRSNMRFWVTSFAILAELLLIVTALPSLGHSSLPQETNVCKTPTCEETASRIKSSMNLEVNPCDDFYQFTCGNYMKNGSGMDEARIQNMYTIYGQMKSQYQSLFATDNEIDDIEPINQARILYESCMNEEVLESKGVEPLIQFIKKLGGWPVIEGAAWKESNFDWMNFIANGNRIGLQLNTFLYVDMKEDSLNPSLRVIALSAPFFYEFDAFKRGFDDSEVRAYYDLVVDTAEHLGADRKTAEKEIKEAILFQIQLNEIIPEYTGKDNEHRMRLKELIKRYPSVDWKTIFVKMYSPMQTIDDNDVVTIENLKFIDNVIKLISNTPKRVQANFAMIQTIQRVIANVSPKVAKKWADYMIINDERDPPRYKICVEVIENKLPSILAAMYMKKIFTSEMKAYAEYMLQSIKDKVRENFDEVAFLDEATKMYAKEKERAIKHIVGYPALDNENLIDYYRDLKFEDDQFFANSLNLRKFVFEKKIAGFSKSLQKINMKTIKESVNSLMPYNDYNSNLVVLPPNVLQKIVLDLQRPHYMNFGTMGMFISRRLTQMFGKPGYNFDVNGSSNNWWTNATKQAFNETSKCFYDQYKKFILDNTGDVVNDIQSLERYIEDNGAVNIAYRAYVNAMGGRQEAQLPGLNYSPNKMFWIAFGNMYCNNESAQEWFNTPMKYSISMPDSFLAPGMISNSKEFANAFGCPLGSKMNPVEKCSAW